MIVKSKIYFEKEGIEGILDKLNNEYDAIAKIYDEIENHSKKISGEGDWQGKGQKGFYNSYLSISKKIPNNKVKLQNCNDFLREIMKAYIDKDNQLLKNIEDNKDNLTINS